MMLTQDTLLDLFVVLGLAVILGFCGTFLHRLAAHRQSRQELRLTLLLHLLH
jgi:H+/Cl- antiporter ClcA